MIKEQKFEKNKKDIGYSNTEAWDEVFGSVEAVIVDPTDRCNVDFL